MSTMTVKSGLSIKAIIAWVVTVLTPVAILCIPTNETFTADIRTFFAITACAIVMFAFDEINSTIPALALPLAYSLTQLVDFGTAMSPWTQPVVWIVAGCFLISGIMERVGILSRVAYWCIVHTGGSYRGIILGFFLAGLILSLLVPVAWVAMVLLAVCKGVCEALKIERTKASCGIYMSALLGYTMSGLFIYTPSQLAIALGAAGLQTSYLDFLIQNIPGIVPFVLMGLLLPVLLKPEKEIQGLAFFRGQYEQMGKMTGDEKKCLIVSILLIIYLFTANFHGLDAVYGFLIAPILLYLPGVRVGRKEDFGSINMGTLIFVASCMGIGTVANVVGAGQYISDMITPVLSGTGDYGFTLLGYVFGFLINFILTPLAAMTTMSAPLAQIATDMGVNPYPVIYSLVIGLDNLLLPYESALHLAAFSFGGMYLKDFAKVMGFKAVLTLVCWAALMIPYWMLIGLL